MSKEYYSNGHYLKIYQLEDFKCKRLDEAGWGPAYKGRFIITKSERNGDKEWEHLEIFLEEKNGEFIFTVYAVVPTTCWDWTCYFDNKDKIALYTKMLLDDSEWAGLEAKLAKHKTKWWVDNKYFDSARTKYKSEIEELDRFQK